MKPDMRLWRSLDEFADTPEFRDLLTREFPAGAAWLDAPENAAAPMRRRRFIQLMGASFGLAGLTSCGRQPTESIVPYVRQPDDVTPGNPKFYATAVSFRGHARGILVESHMGRPTKIEGNPDHPASLGATDAPGQAAILDLYDPDRSRTVKYDRRIATWASFDEALLRRRLAHASKRGAGFAILIEPTSSPTLQRLLRELLAALPEAGIYQHHGAQPAPPAELADFSVPDLIVSIDDDFISNHPQSLRYIRQFVARRRAGSTSNRLYVIEPTPTLTGVMADHRLAVRPSRIPEICRAIAGESVTLTPREQLFVKHLRADLGEFRGRTLVRRGPGVDPGFLSDHETSRGPVAPPTLTGFPGLAELTEGMAAGKIETLLILGGNPAYTAPGDVPFARHLSGIEFTAHLGSHEDETSALCHWHLPMAHFLETWGDIRAFDGSPTVRQPLIEPLYQGRPAISVLAPDRLPLDLVRETWQTLYQGDETGFSEFWRKTLRDGLASPDALASVADIPFLTEPRKPAPLPHQGEGLDLVILPDPNVGTGSQSNNGWLQELPRQFTKLVWDNAALISPALAERLILAPGDIVTLHPTTIKAAVWVMPGQADETVTVHLGYGRTHGGTLANDVGFNAYPLLGIQSRITLRPTGSRHDFVSTQNHALLEGRKLFWELTTAEIASGKLPEQPPPTPEHTLYPDPKKMLNGRYAWAMNIDLSTCVGCNACITACQAENNIPVVGKGEVARGREMHWIRVDRYFIGADPDEPHIVHQPVTCQQCEQAPCEVVCPVEATVHTADGINAMVYNRCVGTRYCSNNCPYKVRRFNFFDYGIKGGKSDPRSLQTNPEVTVRGRGVMEKCTYCLQRIERAVITADRENRRVRDGEIVTACQQACPARAITFGDLRTPGSEVSEVRKDPTAYTLLADVNTRPRTRYLAKRTNPHA